MERQQRWGRYNLHSQGQSAPYPLLQAAHPPVLDLMGLISSGSWLKVTEAQLMLA